MPEVEALAAPPPDTSTLANANTYGYWGKRTDPNPDTVYAPSGSIPAVVQSLTPNTGLHTGTVPGVVIKGDRLFGATAASVNAVACTALSVDASGRQITCTVPALAAAGTFDVAVTVPSGVGTLYGGWVAT